jgi:hypothetical protein
MYRNVTVLVFCYVQAEHREYYRQCNQKTDLCIIGLPDLTVLLLEFKFSKDLTVESELR